MTTVTELLNAARAELGTVEGPGSNNVKYNTAYYGRSVVGLNFAWCQTFAWWVGQQVDAGDILPGKTAWTPGAAAFYREAGRWGQVPRVGAQVFYNISGLGRISHTGYVEHVYADGSWSAIEGNTDVAGGRTGGRVMRQRRSRTGTGGGFGYPAYTDSSSGTPAPQAPVSADARRPDSLPTHRVGDSGSGWIYLIQDCLGIAQDGKFGPKTQAAVRRQQERYREPVTGVVDSWTWVSFIANAGNVLSRGDAKGHSGIEVLQNLLGFRGPELDRDFGPATEAAVKRVQRYGQIKDDGVVGPATRAVLARG